MDALECITVQMVDRPVGIRYWHKRPNDPCHVQMHPEHALDEISGQVVESELLE